MRRQKIISALACIVSAGGLALNGCSAYPAHRISTSANIVSMEEPDDINPVASPLAAADVTPGQPRAVEPAPAARTTAPARSSLEAAISDVRDASSIDAAVNAYTRGMTIDSGNVALHKAYVRKVVDMDVPQLGRSAADR